MAEDTLSAIRADKDLQAGNPAKVKQLIESKLVPHFDTARMTALAMGRNWRSATPEQQKQLTEQFQTLLIRTYSNALTNYRDNAMDYKPLRMDPGDTDVVVRTEVTRPGQAAVQIDYSMEKTADGWKAYDVVVAGVSLVTNYREEFNDMVKSSGVDGLIKALADKNRAPAGEMKRHSEQRASRTLRKADRAVRYARRKTRTSRPESAGCLRARSRLIRLQAYCGQAAMRRCPRPASSTWPVWTQSTRPPSRFCLRGAGARRSRALNCRSPVRLQVSPRWPNSTASRSLSADRPESAA